MSSFKRLEIKRRPRLVQLNTDEISFWDKYLPPLVVKEYSAVTHVDFSPVEPHDYAITSGTRVQVYGHTSNTVKKTISRFKGVASCGKFRSDGRLLVAGGDEGIIRVFDLSNRFILRQFKGHTKSVKSVSFTLDNIHVLSASDDTSIKYWDMSTEQCITEYREHEDYVRSIAINPAASNIILTGSYDHSVKIWDLRTNDSTMTLDHGAPVESLVVYPSGSTCVTAGNNYIKVWDLLNGGRPLCKFSNHQKTITCLAFDGTCKRLLSVGLDRHLKVYSVQDYKVLHSISYPAPLLSVAVSASDSHVIVGMTTRLLSIRHRPYKASNSITQSSSSGPRPGTYRYFMRGQSHKPTSDEYLVHLSHKPKLAKYEKCLRAFKFKQALDAVFDITSRQKAQLVYSVLQELARMDRLRAAISGRSEDEVIPLVIFLRKNLFRYNYTPFLTDVCEIVIDCYGDTVLQSKQLRQELISLQKVLYTEVKFQSKAFELMGIIDTVYTAATVSWNKTKQLNNNDTLIQTSTVT